MSRRILTGLSNRLLVGIAFLTLLTMVTARAQSSLPPVYVTLWFDTEDYILPQDDDATKRVAETLTRAGIRATFKVVGEKARVLEQRGRTDVIAALKQHEIGYHSNTHSGQPTVAVYLQHAGWDEGRRGDSPDARRRASAICNGSSVLPPRATVSQGPPGRLRRTRR